jgi:MSHA biogenesis protein MshP
MSSRQGMRTTVRGGTRRAVFRGFSLVSAIFLLVVLAGLGVAMVNIFTVQQTSSALDVQGVRAYQAARAGIEWGLFQRLRNGDPYCIPGPANPGPTVNSFALPPGTTLSSFTVTVVCSRTAFPGGVVALDRYRIVSTACNQPTGGANPICPNANASPDYVQRVVQVEF